MNDLNCSQLCAEINGTDICFCERGYQLDMDGITCSGVPDTIITILIVLFYVYTSDIDECTENPCEQSCTNTIGSFTCSCNNGYVLDEDGRSCNGMFMC